jgi:hypothetical protein
MTALWIALAVTWVVLGIVAWRFWRLFSKYRGWLEGFFCHMEDAVRKREEAYYSASLHSDEWDAETRRRIVQVRKVVRALNASRRKHRRELDLLLGSKLAQIAGHRRTRS